MHLYIYYDVPRDAVESVRERLRSMRAELSDRPGRLLRRPEARDGVETWMEVYDDVDAAFEARLAAAIDRHRVTALTGPRHTERFEDLV